MLEFVLKKFCVEKLCVKNDVPPREVESKKSSKVILAGGVWTIIGAGTIRLEKSGYKDSRSRKGREF